MNREELLKTAKPILFNTEMVRAILDGRKTQTRRVMKSQPVKNGDYWEVNGSGWSAKYRTFPPVYGYVLGKQMRYKPGDILYVRETWAAYSPTEGTMPELIYRADGKEPKGVKWKPSIFMPKEAARIFLRVTDVKVERLQDIITGDYKTPINIEREGLYAPFCNCPHSNGDCKDFIAGNSCHLVKSYVKLWDSTIPKKALEKYGWEANPWVEVYSFERLEVE